MAERIAESVVTVPAEPDGAAYVAVDFAAGSAIEKRDVRCDLLFISECSYSTISPRMSVLTRVGGHLMWPIVAIWW